MTTTIAETSTFAEKQLCGAPLGGASLDGHTTCRNVAGRQTSHPGMGRCYKHGGNTRPAKIQGFRAIATARAQLALETFATPMDMDPDQALLELVSETAGNVAFLASEVSKLKQGELTSKDIEEREQIKAIVTLYNDERDRLAKFSKLALDANLSERRARLSERQGEALAMVVKALISRLGLTEEQKTLAREYAARELRQLADLADAEQTRLIEGTASVVPE